jgi:hypothetical protein
MSIQGGCLGGSYRESSRLLGQITARRDCFGRLSSAAQCCSGSPVALPPHFLTEGRRLLTLQKRRNPLQNPNFRQLFFRYFSFTTSATLNSLTPHEWLLMIGAFSNGAKSNLLAFKRPFPKWPPRIEINNLSDQSDQSENKYNKEK